MNITTLGDYIELFSSIIIDSGFKRDLQDFTSSLPSNQNNIVTLRDIALKVSSKLDEIYASDLPDSLEKLLPGSVKPFTNEPFDEKMRELIKDKEIPQDKFFSNLNQVISQLNSQIQSNINEIKKITDFIQPYLESQQKIQNDEQKAIISIIFKDDKTTTILKEFSRNLQAWNKILPIYHQVIKSSSPEDIEIVTVQNGSIDFLINIDFDVAINFAELFKVGFKCFMAYLSYKSMAKPLIDSYFGNEKLIAGEKEREKELINNIGIAVHKEIVEQHKKAIKHDKAIERNIDKKVDQVVKLVTSHILKGNDLKLLSIPENVEIEDGDNGIIKDELNTISSQVRQAIKIIPPKEMKILLEKYAEPDEESPASSGV